MHTDKSFDASSVKLSRSDEFWGKIFSSRPQKEKDGRADSDYAAYDMYIDNALALNETIQTLPGTYYFAVPCSCTETGADGSQQPIRDRMEGMFRKSSAQMGHYTGVTTGGFVIDETWQENDGLVNTVSAGAPFGAPTGLYSDAEKVTGVWYVMPVFSGDHMSLQGGMTKRTDVLPFYSALLGMLNSLPCAE